MKKPLLFLVIFILTCGAIGTFFSFSMGETETQSVPINTNIEERFTLENSAYIVEASDSDTFKEQKKNIGNNVVYLEDIEKFFKATSLSDGKTIYKRFTVKDRRGLRVPGAPRHVYWFSALSGSIIFVYEESYTPPPSTLKYGNNGLFAKLEANTVVFKYSEQLYGLIGLGIIFSGPILGMGITIIWLGRIQKRQIQKTLVETKKTHEGQQTDPESPSE